MISVWSQCLLPYPDPRQPHPSRSTKLLQTAPPWSLRHNLHHRAVTKVSTCFVDISLYLANQCAGGVIAGVVVGVGAALGGGALLLVLLLKRRKKKQKSAELKDAKVLGTDNDEGKYIALPSAVAMHNYAIPKQKIQLKQQIASGTHDN